MERNTNRLVIRVIILSIITAGLITGLYFVGPIWDKLQQKKNEIVPKDYPETENDLKKNPLIILDGEEVNSLNDLRSIDPGNLAYEKLNEEEAIEKYGERAKDGVFIFTTKKRSPAPVHSSPDSLPGTVNH